MAFAANTSSALGSSAGFSNTPQAQLGPEVPEVSTEVSLSSGSCSPWEMLTKSQRVGFQAISGETKLRLLPSPWPLDNLPAPTASLLSVAPKKGILAAAGPESVIIGSTDSIRQAYASGGDENVKTYSPQVTLTLGMRISQVVFSANEEWLVLSAENGGGLAVYEVGSLMQGGTQPAFELSTNGIALRALLANPAAEMGELFAVVTMNGQLMVANLKLRQFVSGQNGQLFRDGVSCIAWSNKGKALVAGMGNGSCCQLKPEGQHMADIPSPPGLQGEQHGKIITNSHTVGQSS